MVWSSHLALRLSGTIIAVKALSSGAVMTVRVHRDIVEGLGVHEYLL